MNKIRQNAELILSGWLKLYSTVWNERIVTGMTFNEAYICHLIIHNHKDESITATELCTMTGLLKSQMNKTICEMENIGYIKRTRSTDDRRVVYIKLTKKGIDAYHLSHEKTMLLMDALASSLGEEKSIQTAETLSLVADEMKTILKEGLK